MQWKAKWSIFLLLASLGLECACAGHVYWTDRRSGQTAIRRMGFDGSAPTTGTPLLPVSGDPRGMAVDAAGSRFFFGNGTQIWRAQLDGTGGAAAVTAQSALRDVLFRRDLNALLWGDETAGMVRRADAASFALSGAPDWPKPATGAYYVEVAAKFGRVIWGDSNSTIYAVPLEGSTASTPLKTGLQGLRGIAFDPLTSHLYWCERDAKAVKRAPLTETAGVLSLGAAQVVYGGLDTPHGLALDVLARKLYWTDTGTNSGTGAGDSGVSRGDMDPPFGPQEILIGAANASEPPATVFATQAWDVDLDRMATTYAAWVARFFPRNAPAAQTALDADPDQDSHTNLQEYVLGANPLRLETGSLVKAAWTDQHGVTVMYRRRRNVTDAEHRVEISADLLSWFTPLAQVTEVSVTPVPEDESVEDVVLAMPTEYVRDNQQQFLRISTMHLMP